MLDNTLLVTAVVLVCAAVLSGFLKGRERDRVLKDFDGYHVTLETLDRRLIWGDMHLHPTGIELIYRTDVQDAHHIETSYILYKDEFRQIQAIYRYCDELGSVEWQKRERELHRSFHPGLWRRFQRRSRNFLNLMSDSLGEAVGVLVGYAQVSSKRLSTGSDKYLSRVSQNIIGYMGPKYDPLLERYVGTKVVVEVAEGNVAYEHIGILKDYSSDWIEVLDVHYPNQAAIPIRDSEEVQEHKDLRIQRSGNSLHVTNLGQTSLYLREMRIGGEVTPLSAVLDKNDSLELHLPDHPPEAHIELETKVIRRLDWLLPRTHALVRHKAERYDPDQVFDIGFLLKVERYTDEEERYLGILKDNPEDAPSAVGLAQLLFQRGAVDEAERWFAQAIKYSKNLTDGGKFAGRQLQALQSKKSERKRAV